MNRIPLILAIAALASALAASGTEAKEKYTARTVSHSVGMVTMDPGDGVEGHLLGSARFVGMAFYSDGRIGRVHYLANFDYVKGSGNYVTTQVTTFEDGSQLRARNTGTAVTKDGVTTFPDGRSEIIGGSGRYANATGSCTFTGTRILAIADGGDSYFDSTCEID